MPRLKEKLLALLGIAVLLTIFGGVVWLIYSIVQYLRAVPKELAVQLVAAGGTVLAATFTVMVGRYFERKKELDAQYRDKKTEMYDEFLKTFFELSPSVGERNQAAQEKDLVNFFREFTRKLILWSGPEVIEAFVAWKDHLAKGNPDAQTMKLTEDFLLAIRKDLRQSNHNLRRGFFARLYLKEGAMFLDMEKKNPNVSLKELAEQEKVLRRK